MSEGLKLNCWPPFHRTSALSGRGETDHQAESQYCLYLQPLIRYDRTTPTRPVVAISSLSDVRKKPNISIGLQMTHTKILTA